MASRRDSMMKASTEELFAALLGVMTPLQKELLGEMLRIIREQTVEIERIDKLIEKHNSSKILAGSLPPPALLADYIPLLRRSAFPAMLCYA